MSTGRGLPCAYCGVKMKRAKQNGRWIGASATWDHIIPRAQGGTLTRSNRVRVCRRCNEDKGGMTLQSWLQRLRHDGDARVERVERFLQLRRAAGRRVEPPFRYRVLYRTA